MIIRLRSSLKLKSMCAFSCQSMYLLPVQIKKTLPKMSMIELLEMKTYNSIGPCDIDDSDDAQGLLGEIIKLWVTVRGFSMTATWMEVYKKTEKKTLQKATG